MREPKRVPDSNDIGGGAVFAGTKQSSPIDRMNVPSAKFLFENVQNALRDDLDGPDAQKLHATLMGHYLRELDAHGKARREMETDEDFYDSDQWTEMEKAMLADRGQDAMVFNVIAQSINWVLGTERRSRTDYKVLPRRKEGSKGAERKSQILKYLSDVNLTEFHVSRAFADATKVGVGWLESGVQDDSEGEPIYERAESWRNMLWDSAATELDLQDGRYEFRTRWMDVDNAIAMFPKRATTIDHASSGMHDYANSLDRMGDDAMDSQEMAIEASGYSTYEMPGANRDRVRMIEAWFRIPILEKRISGGDFSGELYDEYSLGHHDDILTGRARIVSKTTFRMFVMIMTTAGPLYLSPSPYRHNRYPFTPIWANRRAKDGMPYGLIRSMRDAQKDINKRFTKAQYILNSQKVIMDEGAVDDLDEFAEEINRADAIIVKKPGKHLQIDVDRELAQSHMAIMELERGMIQSLSGITDESMGRTTNATSGKAIVARQEQGALSTAPLFDNLRLARQFHGEKTLSLVEQFMSDERQFRITNRRGTPEYITINDGMPENDIVRTKADFIISEDDWTATYRQAQVQQLLEVIGQLAPVAPDIVMVLLDLIVEAMDIPSREEIIKRIRSITGQEDPDADPNVQDPEREARDAAKAAQAEMDQRAAEANIAKLESEVAEKQARAEKAKADALSALSSITGKSIADQRAALELAISMLQAEPAVDTADALLSQARNRTGLAARPQPQPQQPPQAPFAGA